MKTKYKGRTTRTSGWKSQPEFDNLLKDLDYSSLSFLNDKYKHDIKDYLNHYDVNNPDYQQGYIEILQRKKMISEEMKHRDYEYEEYFDSETGLVIDRNGDVTYSITFNEEESGYMYHYLNDNEKGNLEYKFKDDETNTIPIVEGVRVTGYTIKYSDRDRKDIYEDWDYYNYDEEDRKD